VCDAEEGAFHSRCLPLVKIAKEEIGAGLHEPVEFITGEEIDDGFGVGGEAKRAQPGMAVPRKRYRFQFP
jgi:hypothetical protein